MHVLVVDDDRSVREMVAMALVLDGHRVTTAVDGADAIAQLPRAAADLVVSDVMMPRVDGWQLLAWVRADPALLSLPFLLLTARGVPDDHARGQALGASALLAKPFEVDELLDLVGGLGALTG